MFSHMSTCPLCGHQFQNRPRRVRDGKCNESSEKCDSRTFNTDLSAKSSDRVDFIAGDTTWYNVRMGEDPQGVTATLYFLESSRIFSYLDASDKSKKGFVFEIHNTSPVSRTSCSHENELFGIITALRRLAHARQRGRKEHRDFHSKAGGWARRSSSRYNS